MCRVMDELRKEAAEEAAEEAVWEERYDFAVTLLNMKKLTKEEIAQAAKITVEEVEELEERLNP